ncbi:carbohydrate biosynthesis protein [Leptospira yasudae]|uniref:TIGR04326 family surface carbohydrate biosynthesis protein n=1 Tax=Leptospira yasudae TaxID=2202201 RepID=UPI000E59E6D9|nr:TIGR04326 family surface carbohydrate biosynthesis protein [Leptospira yasudae]RHX91198.1 carbohydrate biosynthesis protein [Leptospira yasudae]
MSKSVLNQGSVLIWDLSGPCSLEFSGSVYLWKEYSENVSERRISIPQYVDRNRLRLRDKYNSLLYQLGEIRFNSKRIVDWLEIRPNFSYWWMTLIVESNYGKSTFMTNLVKLLALEEILAEGNVSEISLSSPDRNLQKIFREFCKRRKILFSLYSNTDVRIDSVFDVRFIYRNLPNFLKAGIAFFRYLRLVWNLRKQKISRDKIQDCDRIIFDYFFHLRLDSKKPVLFGSNYWADLVEVFRKAKVRTFWSHIFIPHPQIPNSRKAVSILNEFNNDRNEIHNFLEGNIDLIVMVKTLWDYLKINFIRYFIRNVRFYSKTEILSFDLWPILKQDFLDSLSGSTSIQNLFLLNLIEKNLENVSGRKIGIYLQENQAWERALIYFWKSKNLGPLIGVPHATVRFWDLRYFSDFRNYNPDLKNPMPLPDHVALNGIASLNAYKEGKYPQDQIVEVEALRYLEIGQNRTNTKSLNKKDLTKIKILVLTDYVHNVTKFQMKMLTDAMPFLNRKFEFILKPHPACPVYEEDFPGLNLTVLDKPVADLLKNADVVYTSNITSAAVEAFCSGIPVISVLDGNSLNMSPLLGLDRVSFVSTPKELSDALQSDFNFFIEKENTFFCLDRSLTKWKKLLVID